MVMRHPRHLITDLADILIQRAKRCRIRIVSCLLINNIGHDNLPTPLQSKAHEFAAQLIFHLKGQACFSEHAVHGMEIRIKYHERDLNPAGRAVRVDDVVEDTAEVPLGLFASDLQDVWEDELVLAEATLAVCECAGEIEVDGILALNGALHVHSPPLQPTGQGLPALR